VRVLHNSEILSVLGNDYLQKKKTKDWYFWINQFGHKKKKIVFPVACQIQMW